MPIECLPCRHCDERGTGDNKIFLSRYQDETGQCTCKTCKPGCIASGCKVGGISNCTTCEKGYYVTDCNKCECVKPGFYINNSCEVANKIEPCLPG